MFMTKAMGRTNEVVMTGKELKDTISNIDPNVLDVSAFKEGLKASNPNYADAIEELFSDMK